MSNSKPKFYIISERAIIEESKNDPTQHELFFLLGKGDQSGLSFVKVHGGKIYAFEVSRCQYVEIV